MIFNTRTVQLSLLACFYSATVSAFEMPQGTKSRIVAEGIVQNGVEMDIVDVSSSLSPEEFLRSLMPILKTKNGKQVVSEVANNAVSVGVINDKTYESIVISQGPLGSTKGIYSVAYLTNKHRYVAPDFQLPSNSTLVSYTQDNIGHSGRNTWVYSYNKSATYLVNSLEQIAESGGWSQNTGSGYQQQNSNVRYFSFSKPGSTSEIVVQPNATGAAVVVMEQQ